ncbi:Alpha/Beta hydrolase protein [Colletotrichum phormii]|uniref:Alpha/Beta hydrolase protein n=1 Tax=Colletotrichum phormii TaxID=359342 RepID=A0AAJ0A301_9PEZI|nr:Alpha/Beta hydrolase protein [Colletotrichum phormii]KAK1641504.1 Alpha/Beta hydrolase protein [Colletotrichum phormii]
MDLLPHPDDMSRFSDFTILTTTYKTVSDHSITTDVLIPKKLIEAPVAATSPCPIILRYHGGGFIGGASLYPGFFGPWYVELAARHSAVIEETCGHVDVDTDRILTAGDSAGGYLSIMKGLSHAKDIRAVTAAYPCVDLANAHFMERPKVPVFGLTLPQSIVDDHFEKIRRCEAPALISTDQTLERGLLMFANLQHGGFPKMFPLEKKQLFPFERLRAGQKFPRGGVFVWQGADDSVVPAKGNVALKELVREVDPELEFNLTVQPGEHGFDAMTKIDEDWMAGGLKNLVKAWLQ